MDVVNYAIRSIKAFGYNGPRVHFLMIDEIQDLSFGMIHLLDLVGAKTFFFTGDNAQNISKGLSYKFNDLKEFMEKMNYKRKKEVYCQDLSLYHLNYNFRSHNSILEFANPIVGMIELFFPHSLDILYRETSPVTGPKPIVFEIGTDKNLVKQFLNEIISSSISNLVADDSNPDIKFGCNQVIIVKNEDTKERVQEMYKYALCLTVVEAKGLEFDDVVLYDFFNDSIDGKVWEKLINFITLKDSVITEQESELSDVLLRNTNISKKFELNKETKYKITQMDKNEKFVKFTQEIPEYI